jgi:hypothetical protein
MQETIEKGSLWSGNSRTQFQVIDQVVIEDQTWIHYRLVSSDDPKEFSCFKESFLERFTKLPKN